MSLPDSKTLKKLADSCRKAGIKHFKSGDIEFTLTDDPPVSAYMRSRPIKAPASSVDVIDVNYQSNELTEEQLLFWSTGNAEQSEDNNQ